MKIIVDSDELLNGLNESLKLTVGDPIPEWCWEVALLRTKYEIYDEATAEKKQLGKWLVDMDGIYCSKCKVHPDFELTLKPYCAFCGAKMKTRN